MAVTSMAVTSTDRKIATVGVVAAPSWLSQRINGALHADTVRAFVLARETFIGGRRIDMGALASALGVDRTSLFRWVGNRDALLSEVLWSLTPPTLLQAEAAAADRVGADRVATILSHFVGDLIFADYFRDFLRREPARALRLMTTKHSDIQRRFVATAEWIVRRDLGDNPLGGAIDPGALAQLLVRVCESFTYSDLITGELPSAELAHAAFRIILRVD